MKNFKKIKIFPCAVLLITLGITHASLCWAEGDAKPPKKIAWSFSGPLGTFDRAALQRGLQVYREVCSACHGLHQVRFGKLAGKGSTIDDIRRSNLGLTDEEAAAIAGEYKMRDLDDQGEPTERKATLADRFPPPYPNEKAARAANNGAAPPDLSLITKARPGGPNYVYSLLVGYEEPPAQVKVGEGRYYNPYFPGGELSMAPPLHTQGQVTYIDGTEATIDQMAKDVVHFLAWAAEPEMEDRKQLGIKVMVYLLTLTILLYLAKRKIWKNISH